MGPLDSLVSVTITASGATPQIANFGTPAILCYHTKNTDYIRTYTSLAGLVTDGFATTSPTYYMATAILSQTPSPSEFKVIRGSSAVSQSCTFTVNDAGGGTTITGDTYGYQCVGTDGVVVDMYYTPSVAKTPTEVATAIAALTDPTGVATTSALAVVTSANSAAGTIVYYQNVKGGVFIDNTPTASPATDLNNALTVDTDWYTISGEHQDGTNILAVSVWAEANKRINAYSTCDTNAKTASSGIGNTLKAAAYAYSYGQWGGTSIQYGGLASMAEQLTLDPGTYTAAYKTLAGVSADALTATQITALGKETANGNRLNYYIEIANVNVTRFGINASGMYADIRRGIDALAASIQIAVYQLLVATPKPPLDPAGIAIIGNAVRGVLSRYTATPVQPAALLRGDPGYAPVVILPAIGDISTTDRGNRYLSGIRFTAYAQNAVQLVAISGAVNT
jgi:hypothetical protein